MGRVRARLRESFGNRPDGRRLRPARGTWRFLTGWSWKTALLSATGRGLVYFVINLTAGPRAAREAFVTEFVFRAIVSGFAGRAIESLRGLEPRWRRELVAVWILPLGIHALEFTVHRARGTAALAWSTGASVTLSIASAAFHLFVMRRGILLVGAGRLSLREDLRRMPAIVRSLVTVRDRDVGRVGDDQDPPSDQ